MPAATRPIEMLKELASEFRHLRHEHEREGQHSSRRREHAERLEEIEQRFEMLLGHWVPDEAARQAWRVHLREGGAPPDDELEAAPPLFVGRNQLGSQVEVRERSESEYDVFVDGHHADRFISERFNLGSGPLASVSLAGKEWEEVVQASAPALAALQGYVRDPGQEPPWQWSRELYADGLIDADFALTDRGRRLLATQIG